MHTAIVRLSGELISCLFTMCARGVNQGDDKIDGERGHLSCLFCNIVHPDVVCRRYVTQWADVILSISNDNISVYNSGRLQFSITAHIYFQRNKKFKQAMAIEIIPNMFWTDPNSRINITLALKALDTFR
ncbi:hypothetical protein DPMN_048496 [Dreissena polymorpha]|uniref:Uncharacterized protein n=1 Tax=Dreissena polymorpha TaxID=45954 RepID=A0A9D4DBQ3_DREPO|nr:hypothetical protein DPMN_048496 [Dreissena polymorpha]